MDGIYPDHKRVVYFDGHTDTVQALRSDMAATSSAASTRTTGLSTSTQSTASSCAPNSGHLPPDDEWEHLVFGRGAADQLAGVVSQIVATKIALELAPEGALRGVIVRAYATACRGGQRRRRTDVSDATTCCPARDPT